MSLSDWQSCQHSEWRGPSSLGKFASALWKESCAPMQGRRIGSGRVARWAWGQVKRPWKHFLRPCCGYWLAQWSFPLSNSTVDSLPGVFPLPSCLTFGTGWSSASPPVREMLLLMEPSAEGKHLTLSRSHCPLSPRAVLLQGSNSWSSLILGSDPRWGYVVASVTKDPHRRLESHLFQAWLASLCSSSVLFYIFFPFSNKAYPFPTSLLSWNGPVSVTVLQSKTWKLQVLVSPAQSPPCLIQHAALSWWGSVHQTVSLSLGSWVNTANLWPHWFAFLRELNLFLFIQNFPRQHTKWLMTSPFSKIQLYFNPVTLKGDLGVLKLWAHSCRNSLGYSPPPFLSIIANLIHLWMCFSNLTFQKGNCLSSSWKSASLLFLMYHPNAYICLEMINNPLKILSSMLPDCEQPPLFKLMYQLYYTLCLIDKLEGKYMGDWFLVFKDLKPIGGEIVPVKQL